MQAKVLAKSGCQCWGLEFRGQGGRPLPPGNLVELYLIDLFSVIHALKFEGALPHTPPCLIQLLAVSRKVDTQPVLHIPCSSQAGRRLDCYKCNLSACTCEVHLQLVMPLLSLGILTCQPTATSDISLRLTSLNASVYTGCCAFAHSGGAQVAIRAEAQQPGTFAAIYAYEPVYLPLQAGTSVK